MVRKSAKKAARPKKHYEHFETTIPVFKPCSRCRSWLAAGVVDGMHVKVDLTQLGPSEALFAMLAGLQLFSMSRTGLVHLDKYRLLDPRYSGRLPEHRCGVVWATTPVVSVPVTSQITPDNPPY